MTPQKAVAQDYYYGGRNDNRYYRDDHRRRDDQRRDERWREHEWRERERRERAWREQQWREQQRWRNRWKADRSYYYGYPY